MGNGVITEGLLRTSEVVARTAATYRQLDYWIRCDVVMPVQPGFGSGASHGWSATQLPLLNLLAALSTMGARHNTLRRVARTFAGYDFAARPEAFVVVSADGAAVQHLAVGLAEEVRLNGPSWVIPVAASLPAAAAAPARPGPSAAGQRAGTGAAGPDRDSGDDTAPDATGGGPTQRGADQTAQGAA
jgi:hypothetical protein